jgi:hypothetical protein
MDEKLDLILKKVELLQTPPQPSLQLDQPVKVPKVKMVPVTMFVPKVYHENRLAYV